MLSSISPTRGSSLAGVPSGVQLHATNKNSPTFCHTRGFRDFRQRSFLRGCSEAVHYTVLTSFSANDRAVIINAKHEGVGRSWGIDNVICALMEHEAMSRTATFVRRIGNRECACDISPLVNPAAAGAWKDRSGRVKQLNIARLTLEKGVKRGIGSQHFIPCHHAAVVFGSVQTGEAAAWETKFVVFPLFQDEAEYQARFGCVLPRDVTRVVDSEGPGVNGPWVIKLGKLAVTEQEPVVAVPIAQDSDNVTPSVKSTRGRSGAARIVNVRVDAIVKEEVVVNAVGVHVVTENVAPGIDTPGDGCAAIWWVNSRIAVIRRE